MFIKTKQRDGIDYLIADDPIYGILNINDIHDDFHYQLYVSSESEKYYLVVRGRDELRSKFIYYVYVEDIEKRSDVNKLFIPIYMEFTDEVIDLLVQFRSDFSC